MSSTPFRPGCAPSNPTEPPITPLRNHTILTGDRPTGPLHLGHLAGSLRARVDLQAHNQQTVLVADLQALTDNAHDSGKVRRNITTVVLDYLSVGIDPHATTIALQSGIPALSELTMLYLNLVTMPRLLRNPTIRAETTQRGFGTAVPAGFVCYPVSQAADITAFGADLVPAGDDQAPLIEQTNEIVRAINTLAGQPVLVETTLLRSTTPRLLGTDGATKMSKSANNAVFLSDDSDTVRAKIMAAFTDPHHLRVTDPGRTEGNAVFALLDAFCPDRDEVAATKAHYEAGGLGDVAMKRRVVDVINATLDPIRARRATFTAEDALAILAQGTQRAAQVAQARLDSVRQAFGLIPRPNM